MDYQWKCRVVKRTFRNPHEHVGTAAFSIFEIFRDENDNITAIAVRNPYPSGETAEQLKADIGAMLEAFQLPVLDYDQITEQIAKRVRP